MKLTNLDTNKLSELIAVTEATPIPVAADTDDSCGITVIVEEAEDMDESTTIYKRRKVDDSEVDDV